MPHGTRAQANVGTLAAMSVAHASAEHLEHLERQPSEPAAAVSALVRSDAGQACIALQERDVDEIAEILSEMRSRPTVRTIVAGFAGGALGLSIGAICFFVPSWPVKVALSFLSVPFVVGGLLLANWKREKDIGAASGLSSTDLKLLLRMCARANRSPALRRRGQAVPPREIAEHVVRELRDHAPPRIAD